MHFHFRIAEIFRLKNIAIFAKSLISSIKIHKIQYTFIYTEENLKPIDFTDPGGASPHSPPNSYQKS